MEVGVYGGTNYRFYNPIMEVGVYGDTNNQFCNLALEVGVYGDTNYRFCMFCILALEVGVYGDTNYRFCNLALCTVLYSCTGSKSLRRYKLPVLYQVPALGVGLYSSQLLLSCGSLSSAPKLKRAVGFSFADTVLK